jgi:hypothetical protein
MWYLWFPVRQLSVVLSTLWHGQYSLGKSFWGFFLLGTFVSILLGMLAAIPFVLIEARLTAGIIFQLVFWGYAIIAAVGVWRSSNTLIEIRSGRASASYADSVKMFAAKFAVIRGGSGSRAKVSLSRTRLCEPQVWPSRVSAFGCRFVSFINEARLSRTIPTLG